MRRGTAERETESWKLKSWRTWKNPNAHQKQNFFKLWCNHAMVGFTPSNEMGEKDCNYSQHGGISTS
jgi:hypothetical protein